MKKVYELTAMYDSRKSFYGKAKVIDFENGVLELLSYNTIVAQIIDGELIWDSLGSYSVTTNRHIREFIKQFATSGKEGKV